ncbi:MULTISPECIES: radical SAM/SPASM domain-containing protein [Bacteroidales]|jgi:radical SAM protein with 4Fe4S-binding SPASM domain|uniref:radical SAM/SPASM domain-containing protein n=1 Tax=Bacteroidales TaxID=171549 RepID=UPI00266BBB04|nr:radical SAM protein [Phocaeicola coprophilus]
MKILFNPIYRLKVDKGKVFIFHRGGIVSAEDQHDEGFCGAIHPLHAIILSFLNGKEIDDTIEDIRKFIPIDAKELIQFITNLVDCECSKVIHYKNYSIVFPSRLIIVSDKTRDIVYNPKDFLLDNIDLSVSRPISVSKLTLMVNNICSTNCYYCYADKRKIVENKISIERYKQIIEEAKINGVVAIDVIGGEFFLYSHWKQLYKFLVEHNYYPLLSTKMCLKESDIQFLSSNNCTQLQFSLDSLIPQTLNRMLGVNDRYVENVKHTLRLLDKYGIKIAIHSILTQKNSTEEDFKSIFDFIKDFTNILYWKPDVGAESIYVNTAVHGSIVPTKKAQASVSVLCNKLQKNANFPILSSGLEEKEMPSSAKTWAKFNERSVCAGNYLQLFVLPDGNVTICEELYWHPKFIVGNILEQSLNDIWNSKAALNLYHLKQSEISDVSPCKTCRDYEACRIPKQVCYRDIVRKYGAKHWDYPDVNCPKCL